MKSSKRFSVKRNHRFWSRRKPRPVVVDLLPRRVGVVQLGVQLLRGLERRVHHVLREGVQLGAGGHQLLQRARVARVVLGLHVHMRVRRGVRDDGLVLGRQAVVGLLVDVQRQLRATFPPAGVVIECWRHLVQAELEVVVRAHPFGGVDGAFFQRLVDLATGDVLRHRADLLEHLAAEAADAHLQALHVGQRIDLLAEEAAHLRAGVAHREVDDVDLGVELAHQLQAVALEHPGRHLAAVQAEGDGAIERVGRVLAEEVVRRGVRAFDGAVGHAVQHAEGRHQLAAGVHGDRELAAGLGADLLGELLGGTVDGVQRLRKARSQAPADGGLGLHDGRCATSGQDTSQAGTTNK